MSMAVDNKSKIKYNKGTRNNQQGILFRSEKKGKTNMKIASGSTITSS